MAIPPCKCVRTSIEEVDAVMADLRLTELALPSTELLRENSFCPLAMLQVPLRQRKNTTRVAHFGLRNAPNDLSWVELLRTACGAPPSELLIVLAPHWI